MNKTHYKFSKIKNKKKVNPSKVSNPAAKVPDKIKK